VLLRVLPPLSPILAVIALAIDTGRVPAIDTGTVAATDTGTVAAIDTGTVIDAAMSTLRLLELST
jgi:hypothetical protein